MIIETIIKINSVAQDVNEISTIIYSDYKMYYYTLYHNRRELMKVIFK